MESRKKTPILLMLVPILVPMPASSSMAGIPGSRSFHGSHGVRLTASRAPPLAAHRQRRAAGLPLHSFVIGSSPSVQVRRAHQILPWMPSRRNHNSGNTELHYKNFSPRAHASPFRCGPYHYFAVIASPCQSNKPRPDHGRRSCLNLAGRDLSRSHPGHWSGQICGGPLSRPLL